MFKMCCVVSGAFDNLAVETEDGKFPLIQLGQILQKSPQLVVINMASSPQVRLADRWMDKVGWDGFRNCQVIPWPWIVVGTSS